MRTRTILASATALFLGIGLAFAADVNMGTWKLNEAKSKFPPGVGKNTMVVYTAEGGKIKVVVDGVDGDGKPGHNEWVGMFDGKDYPLTGDPSFDSRSYRKIDDHTMDLAVKKAGKVVITGRIVIAADGKSRTVTTTSKDDAGKEVKSVAVYDRQ